MRLPLAFFAAVALLAGAAMPAGAADLATVRAGVTHAMQAAKSVVLTTTTTNGLSATMTYVAPDRSHTALTSGGTNYDVVVVGANAYISVNNGPYRQTSAPPQFLATQAQLRDVPVDDVLPDTTIDGTTYGQFATASAGPQHDQHLTCAYDKTTYRIARCSGEGGSMTIVFSRYDDAANVVTVPPVASTAPSASPQP